MESALNAFNAANDTYATAWTEKNNAQIEWSIACSKANGERMAVCIKRFNEAKKRLDEAKRAYIARGGEVETYGDIDTDHYMALKRQG